MAREKSWLWEHFHQGPAKVDKVHWQARCKYCVMVKAKDLGNADQQAVAHGILQAVRTRTILTQEACDNAPHIAGKVEIMANHLLGCQYVPGNWRRHESKRQTRLGVQNNHDMSFLKTELRRQHAIDGTAQCRLKRQFSNPETVADHDPTGSRMEDQELVMNADIDTLLTDKSDLDDGNSNCVVENGPESNDPSPSSFSAVVLQLLQDANDDNNDDYTSGLGEVIKVEEDISHPAEVCSDDAEEMALLNDEEDATMLAATLVAGVELARLDHIKMWNPGRLTFVALSYFLIP
ncbi:hypothetical protein BDR03DRAFT_978754 [Suillus americanus]|nr:hypothetical protein BDR03DRAFT_978754 [Suillus americanus]